MDVEHKATAADAEDRREGQGPNRRETVVDRRSGLDKRRKTAAESGYDGPERRVEAVDRREDTGLERRRGPGRRLSDDRRNAEEGEMSAEQYEFVMAIDTYKKVNKRMYPSWTEVLEVVMQLGYRKVELRDIVMPSVPEPQLQQRKSA
jgi:IS5 family transposase